MGAASGGVDSTVAVKRIKEATGSRSHAVLVDHCLIRLDECAGAKEAIGKYLGVDIPVAGKIRGWSVWSYRPWGEEVVHWRHLR